MKPLNRESGFSLIELLVVIGIIGILAGLFVPLTLRWINRARESEAVVYIGSINRAQQDHFTEFNQFANEFDQLGISVQGTPHYRYSIQFVDAETAIVHAEPNRPMMRGFAGAAWKEGDLVRVKTCEGTVWSVPVCLPE